MHIGILCIFRNLNKLLWRLSALPLGGKARVFFDISPNAMHQETYSNAVMMQLHNGQLRVFLVQYPD